MDIDRELRKLAERQHAVVSRRQASALGASRKQLTARLAGPDWERATPRVMRLSGAPRTAQQALMVAVLDAAPGSVVSHLAAAALWRLPGFPWGPVEISQERGRSGRPSSVAVVHRPRYLPAAHTTVVEGIPVTTLARTLFDLAGDRSVHPARVERTVDTVLGRCPASLSLLHSMLTELAEHGRSGIAAMRAVLQERPVGYVAPASGLEARLVRILGEAGEPPLDRQVDVGGHEWVGRVDFVDRRAQLLVEVDSAAHHTSKLDRDHDRQRDRALLDAGWRGVVRISEEQIWHRPWEAVAAIRRGRGAGRGAA